MKIIITCGPSIAPIDEVRRITNFSTGALGIALANAFAGAGREVVCLRGSAAASAARLDKRVSRRTFSTNGDLAATLRELGEAGGVGAIFHAAALCDYEVGDIRGRDGRSLNAAKIPSREGEITLTLKPAMKVIVCLREWFPTARIVGWKYELAGSRQDAMAGARRQLAEAKSDACIVNGRAYGRGFGMLEKDGSFAHFPNKSALAPGLVAFLNR